jgi:hypothetical protein
MQPSLWCESHMDVSTALVYLTKIELPLLSFTACSLSRPSQTQPEPTSLMHLTTLSLVWHMSGEGKGEREQTFSGPIVFVCYIGVWSRDVAEIGTMTNSDGLLQLSYFGRKNPFEALLYCVGRVWQPIPGLCGKTNYCVRITVLKTPYLVSMRVYLFHLNVLK